MYDSSDGLGRGHEQSAPGLGANERARVTGAGDRLFVGVPCARGRLFDCGSLANSIPPTGPMRRSSLAATAPFIAILADWRSSRLEYICQSPVEIGVRRNALRAIVGA